MNFSNRGQGSVIMVFENFFKIRIIFLHIIFIMNIGCFESRTSKKFEFEEYTIKMIHDGYKSNQFTVSDVVSYYLKNIELIDKAGPELNSIISVNKNALKIASKLDSSLIEDKEIGPLFGIPVIIKCPVSLVVTAVPINIDESVTGDDSGSAGEGAR